MPNPRAASPITTRWNSAHVPDPDLHRLLRLLFGNDPGGSLSAAEEAEAVPLRAVREGGVRRKWSPRSAPANPTGAGGVSGGSSPRPHRGGVA